MRATNTMRTTSTTSAASTTAKRPPRHWPKLVTQFVSSPGRSNNISMNSGYTPSDTNHVHSSSTNASISTKCPHAPSHAKCSFDFHGFHHTRPVTFNVMNFSTCHRPHQFHHMSAMPSVHTAFITCHKPHRAPTTSRSAPKFIICP